MFVGYVDVLNYGSLERVCVYDSFVKIDIVVTWHVFQAVSRKIQRSLFVLLTES